MSSLNFNMLSSQRVLTANVLLKNWKSWFEFSHYSTRLQKGDMVNPKLNWKIQEIWNRVTITSCTEWNVLEVKGPKLSQIIPFEISKIRKEREAKIQKRNRTETSKEEKKNPKTWWNVDTRKANGMTWNAGIWKNSSFQGNHNGFFWFADQINNQKRE